MKFKIESNEWYPGMKIPSERELCQIYDVSRITVRNALNELVNRGNIEKIQGVGTFVLGKSIIQNLGNIYSFSKEMEKQGKITATTLVEKSVIKPDLAIARNLGISDDEEVIFILRLRCTNNSKPIMVERTYFPYKKYEFVLDIDLKKHSLYKTLEEKYNIVFDKAIERFKACELTKDECKYLSCMYPQYGLLVRRTSYINNEVACYSSIVSKGDLFEFTVKLQ